LDIGAFPKDELARRSSLAALLFRLEQRHLPEELEQLMGEVIGWFRQHEDFERLRGCSPSWFARHSRGLE